jgi:hypothetical protein
VDALEWIRPMGNSHPGKKVDGKESGREASESEAL